MKLAECRGLPWSLFFPNRQFNSSRSEEYQHYAEAVGVCNKCKVKSECLEYALERPSTDGIWGGTSERERVRIRRQRGYATRNGS